jgi:5'-nucleotidase
MKYDAVAFGNHEFDNGIEGLEPYLRALNTTVVNSNIRDHGSAIKNLFKPRLIKNIGGQRIGIIGYTTTETPALSNTGAHLEFDDEIRSLQIQADALQMEGVDKIIAIGHAGINIDRKICQEVKGVDIVVGGHTNTFLYTGTPPSFEEPEGKYPEVYTNTGSPCLVVQDYAFGKYLGKLKVVFNDFGVPIKWDNNNPVLIDSRYAPDPEMENLLNPYEAKLEHYTKTVIGTTAVGLDGDRKSCRLKECNLGNVLADAAVFKYIEKTGSDLAIQRASGEKSNSTTQTWSRVAIGLWNGGGIRDFVTNAWTNITLEDLFSMMPFGNTVELIQLKGDVIRQAFEYAVRDYQTEDAHGRFLQVSGVKVVYDLSRPKNERVVSLLVRCDDCPIPDYTPLDMNKIYDVVTITYLTIGGDGFTMIRDNILKSDSSEILDIDVVMDYIKRYQPIVTGNDGRIRFLNSDKGIEDVCKERKTSGQQSSFASVRFDSICIFLTSVLVSMLQNRRREE